MIQAIHKGVEIEMEIHQFPYGLWKCDYTLIKHPERTQTIFHGDKKFATMDLAKESALQEGCYAIDRDNIDNGGLRQRMAVNPPRQVRV